MANTTVENNEFKDCQQTSYNLNEKIQIKTYREILEDAKNCKSLFDILGSSFPNHDFTSSKKLNPSQPQIKRRENRNIILMPLKRGLVKSMLLPTDIKSIELCATKHLLDAYKSTLTTGPSQKIISDMINDDDIYYAFESKNADYIYMILAAFGQAIGLKSNSDSADTLVVTKIPKKTKIDFIPFLCSQDCELLKNFLHTFYITKSTLAEFMYAITLQSDSKNVSKASLVEKVDDCILKVIRSLEIHSIQDCEEASKLDKIIDQSEKYMEDIYNIEQTFNDIDLELVDCIKNSLLKYREALKDFQTTTS